MSTRVEQHGCIVCGQVHTLNVTYASDGTLVKCDVTSLGGRRVFDPNRPMVACTGHSAAEIEAAYDRHKPGRLQEEDEEE